MHTPNTVLGRLWQCASPHLLRTCKKTSSTHPYFKILIQSSFFLFSFPFLFQVVGRVHEQRCRISARLKIGKPCKGCGWRDTIFQKILSPEDSFFLCFSMRAIPDGVSTRATFATQPLLCTSFSDVGRDRFQRRHYYAAYTFKNFNYIFLHVARRVNPTILQIEPPSTYTL